MRINFSTLAFGYTIKSGGGTPNWGTALGQGQGHRINNSSEIHELLKGVTYSSVPLEKVSAKIGKNGRMTSGGISNSPIVLGALFTKVFFNRTPIIGGKFILIITRDTSKSHAGRLLIKYGPSNTYTDGSETYSNDDLFAQMRKQLNLADDACWFVSAIDVINQDELHLEGVIVDANGPVEYSTVQAQHTAWEDLEPSISQSSLSSGIVGSNILLYGVPGCGKSKTIDNDYCDDDSFRERVVFHPDYTYSDFVGQILPHVEKDATSGKTSVSYEFAPGPFTNILKKAVNNIEDPEQETKSYYLVIEEINRGNAPAIFGDVFQLLDRDSTGESEYAISNQEIATEVYGDGTRKIKIPSNLFVLATMNTSDQNVFTLDTAFKRRWSMKHIRNDIDACEFADHPVCGSDVSWASFVKTINELIVETANENFGNEDNRLGAYFVRESELDDPREFGEKVLMYLRNDVFKYDPTKIFKPNYRTLDELIEGFRVDGLEVFNGEVVSAFKNNDSNDDNQEATIEEYLQDKQETLVQYYNKLREYVVDRIPNLREGATKGKNYAFWRADDLKKSGFADFKFQNNKITIETELPRDPEWATIGIELPKDGHHKHYFQIEFDVEKIMTIADILIDAYEQLRQE